MMGDNLKAPAIVSTMMDQTSRTALVDRAQVAEANPVKNHPTVKMQFHKTTNNAHRYGIHGIVSR